MIRQYRHPVRTLEWELPAGLLDEAGEPPWEAGRARARRGGRPRSRDLARPGRLLLLARRGERVAAGLPRPDVRDAAPQEGFVREGEEAGITAMWVPLDEAYERRPRRSGAQPRRVVGVLTAWGARARGWAPLRPYERPVAVAPGLPLRRAR